jgi:hypothetical protein
MPLPCNTSRLLMVAQKKRGFENPARMCGASSPFESTTYEIVTDYTGFAKIKSVCGLLSTYLANADGTPVMLTLEVVFYDSDVYAADRWPTAGLPPPAMTELASTQLDITAHWGGYEIAAKLVENLDWVVPQRTRYVGFRWTTACPVLFFEETVDPWGNPHPPQMSFGPGRYMTTIWHRNGPGTQWLSGAPTGIDAFSIELTPMAVCRDNITMDTEECDGGIMCTDCKCPFGYENDNFQLTGWAPLGCQCPDAVLLDPHWFVGPPSVNVTRNGESLMVGVYLPQARPSRWTATAGFAKWDGTMSTESKFNWELTHYECYFYGEKEVTIASLFENFDYHMHEKDDYYELDFAVNAHWWERIVFGRNKTDGYYHPVDRTMTATLVIGLLIDRTVSVNSTIWILDPNIIWAYVAKSFLYLVDGDFYVDLEIVTRVKSENITINRENFWAVGKDANTQAIMWVENLTSISGPIQDPKVQYWRFRVHLNADPCSTDYHDNYTLSYELISLRGDENINSYRNTFFLTISKFEDWCGVTAQLDGLEANQKTYLDVELEKPATRFWPNDTVVVGVEILAKYGINVENVTLVSSKIAGPGLKSDHVLYNLTTGWVHPLFKAADLYGVSANCTGKMGCYSFVLWADAVIYNKPVTIYTTVFFAASGGVKRSVTIEHTATVSRFSVVQRTGPLTEEGENVENGTVEMDKGYFSSPVVLAVAILAVVPVVSLIIIVWATRSRN